VSNNGKFSCFFGFVLLFFWHLGINVSAQSCPTTLTYVPLPVDIEGVTMVPSRFYLIIPFGPCDVLLSDTKPKSTEAAVAAMDLSLIQGDFNAYQKTFSPLADTNETFVKDIFDQQSAAFQKDPPDRITQKYDLGQLAYFVVGNPAHPFLDHLVIIRSTGKKYYNGRSYTLNPLVENLDAVVGQLPDDFKAFAAPPAGDYFKVAYVLPYDHGPVTCAFQGELVNVDILKQPLSHYAGRYSDLISFYASAYENLIRRDEASYLARFSPESRKQQMALIDREDFGIFARTATQDAHNVRFILDADPVYLVFWDATDVDALHYDTFLKTDEGKYEWVNIQHQNALDHLLADPSFASALNTLVVGADQ